jgi:hypothetical protein
VVLTGSVDLASVDIGETIANLLAAGEGEVALRSDGGVTPLAVEGMDLADDALGQRYPTVGDDAAPEGPRPA